MSTRLRAAVVATLVALPMFLLIPVASAHAGLLGTTPATDAVLSKSPAEVVLTFDEAVLDKGAGILVTDASGRHYEQAGTLNYGGAKISIQLDPLGAPGTYTVAWRVVADDGDPQSQTYPFQYQPPGSSPSSTTTPSVVAAPAATSDASGTTTDESGSAPWVPVAIIVGVAVAAGLVVWILRSGRGTGDSSGH